MAGLLDKLCPDRFCDCLADVDLEDLKRCGVDTIIMDLDNTLLPWGSCEVPEAAARWVARAKELGFYVCVLSNTHYPKRLNKIAAELGIFAVPQALKPRKKGFVEAVQRSGSTPGRSVVIGDQLLTDILGGNLCGMRTILVRPVARREFVGTKLSRLVERLIFPLLKARGKLGTNHEPSKSEKKDNR